MFDKLMDFVAEHKTIATIGLTALIFICFGIMQGMLDSGNDAPPSEPSVAEEHKDDAASDAGKVSDPEKKESGETVPSIAPSQVQSAVLEKASDDVKDVLRQIESVTWTEETGHGLLRFNNGSFKAILPSDDDSENNAKSGYLALSSIEAAPIAPPIEEGGQLSISIGTATGKTGAGHVLYFGRYAAPGTSGNPILYLRCDLFGDCVWTSAANYKALSLDTAAKESKALRKAFHNKLRDVEKKLRDWAKGNCTLGTTAVWDGKLTYDEKAGSTSAMFVIPDPTANGSDVELARVRATWLSEKNGIIIEREAANE